MAENNSFSNLTTNKIISAQYSKFLSVDEIEEMDLVDVNFSETFFQVDGREPSSTITTQVGLEWNEQVLFVFFRGRFEELRGEFKTVNKMFKDKTQRLWERSEVYEVLIGPQAKQYNAYKEFQVAPDGRWFDGDVNNNLGLVNNYWYSGMQCKSYADKEMNIWSAVIELPWSCFGACYDTVNEWNVNFYRSSGKNFGDELLAWLPTGKGERCFHRSEYFGKIDFVME